MELIDYNKSMHSIIIDKSCLMEYSIIKERNLHSGGLNSIDDFKNSIGFVKTCIMEYSISTEKKCCVEFFKKEIFGELHIQKQKLTLWSTPCQCNLFVLWSNSKISHLKNFMPM